MSLFDNLEIEDLGTQEDVIGGGYAKVDKTGFYEFEIEKAYGGTSSGGAISITLGLKADNGARLTVTEYISSGTAKGCKNYYIDKNGDKQYLPGYNKIKSLDALLTGSEKAYPKVANGNVMIWDRDAGKELPQEKQVLTEFVGKRIGALIKVGLEDKYNDEYNSREFQEITHFLDAKTGRTRNEIVAGTSGFKDKWLAKFGEDFILDKRDKSKNSTPSGNAPLDKNTDDVDMDDCPFN